MAEFKGVTRYRKEVSPGKWLWYYRTEPSTVNYPMVPAQGIVTGSPSGLVSPPPCTRKHADEMSPLDMIKRLEAAGYDVMGHETYVKLLAFSGYTPKPDEPKPARKPCQFVGGSRYCKAHDAWHN